MLSPTQLSKKMQDVPVIELSYENSTSHNKVSESYQIGIAIPRSKKYVVWFTFFEEHDICILLELNREKKVASYRQINTIFDTQEPHLGLGTLLYGSFITEIGNGRGLEAFPLLTAKVPPFLATSLPDQFEHMLSFFVIEDVLIYRGVSVRKLTFGDRLGILYHILHDPTLLPSNVDSTVNVIFRLPLLFSSTQTITSSLQEQAFYKIHHIQYRSLTHIVPYLNQSYGTNPHIGRWNQTAPVAVRPPSQLVVGGCKPPDQPLQIEHNTKPNPSHNITICTEKNTPPNLSGDSITFTPFLIHNADKSAINELKGNVTFGIGNAERCKDNSGEATRNSSHRTSSVTTLPSKFVVRGIQPPDLPTTLVKKRYAEPVGRQCEKFWVTADIQSDIYHLVDPTCKYQVDFAYIPNYRTSIFMNSLFRNIKENRNLDAIEESDDDEDFYDHRYDKYVDLNKRLFMECMYHKKFRRWIPFRNIST